MFIPDPSDGERSLDKSLWTDGLLASVLLALAPRAHPFHARSTRGRSEHRFCCPDHQCSPRKAWVAALRPAGKRSLRDSKDLSEGPTA